MKRTLHALAVLVMALAPGWALARDAALILVAEKYYNMENVAKPPRAAEMRRALAQAGFEVITAVDASAQETRDAVEAFRDQARLADRVVILVAGHMVHNNRDSWLLTRGAKDPTDVTVGAEGVSLGALTSIAARHPGQAVVLIAPSGAAIKGPGLGIGPKSEAPQGVTVLTGPGQRLVRLAADVILKPGVRLGEALVPPPNGVEVSGFVSDALAFVPATQTGRPQPPGPQPPNGIDMELAFWNVVVELDTIPAYQAYLDRYPNGRFRAVARAAIDGAALDAEAQAQATEAALGLNRNDRRNIQRDLSLLGHNPHGIDGIFGPGTRAAITAWQRGAGFDPNGYLTAQQVGALSRVAKDRRDQLAAEAAARKAEEERRDTAYWRDTGRGGSEAGLRAYLERFPDGLFADIAEAELARIEAAQRARAEAAERQFWDEVRGRNTANAYQRYLDRYPNGLFADNAKARIRELTKDDTDAVIAAAKAEEKQVVGNGVLRLLVENRLAAAGQDPGPIDARFDKTTRRAIRRFQRDQGLTVTGYVTQATMVRLLAVP